jgi:glycosyltransferase involved in cell wall biosynthesis
VEAATSVIPPVKPLTISIAMATYNGGRFVSEQLRSLAGQELPPTELVVTDDGSTDGTADLIEAFADSAPFSIRVHRNAERLGVLRNFEKALSLCNGDIIFLSDQDDVWLPDKIISVMAAFEAHPEALVILNDKIITDENLVPSGATMLTNIRGFGSPDSCFVAGCCAAFRRQWLDFALPIPEGPPAHDSWLLGLAHRLEKVELIERPLQYYRRHSINFSQNSYSVGRRVNLWDRVKAELGGGAAGTPAPEAYWGMFLDWHQAEADRIGERAASLGIVEAEEGATRALAEIDRQVRAEKARLHISTLPRHRRPGPVWRLWKTGGYNLFTGWKSVLKDLLR